MTMGQPRGKGNNPDTLVGGFLRADSGTTVPHVEQPIPDELSQSAAPDLTPDEVKAVRKARRGRSLKLVIMGISSTTLAKADPSYRNAVAMANNYRRKRAAELSEMHGHVSIGASALLASASLAWAASRHLYEKYAEDGGGSIGTAMLKQAASLGDSARQSELAAWELSAREGLVKRKRASQDQGVPWLAVADGGSKLGRKTNAERQQRSNESVVVENGNEVYLTQPVTPEDVDFDNA